MSTTHHVPTFTATWSRLVEVFGSEALSSLVGATEAEIATYLDGQTEPPPSVTNRVTYLALVTDRLASRYSDAAIRGWFSRTRMQLCGMSAAEVLASEWFPESPGAQRVREIAYSAAMNQ